MQLVLNLNNYILNLDAHIHDASFKVECGLW